MAYQLSLINAAVTADPIDFMVQCDRAFQSKVTEAADFIIQNMAHSPVVLMSGPSGSGKTTTALKIEEELRRRGVVSHTISLDKYFMTPDPRTIPRTETGAVDYESPSLLDMPLLNAHFTALERGEEISIPHFEFARQMRNDNRATTLRLGPNEIAIFEGIHALNDTFTDSHPNATRLYISARSSVEDAGAFRFKSTWMRLARRAVRDYSFRGTGVETTLFMWGNVRRGEKLYISPFRHKAHIIFDSSLPYEVSVMATYARPLLEAVPPESQRQHELRELITSFDYFVPIDPQLVPAESLLREFIGGGSYHY